MADREEKNKTFPENTTVKAIKDHVSCKLSDEVVILSFQDGTYYGLNAVGARIWELIDEPRTVKELVDSLLEGFDVERAQCESDVQAFLGEMHGRNLIAVAGSDPDQDQG